jgi:ABC-type polysaccharide/polyol phosphate export permease
MRYRKQHKKCDTGKTKINHWTWLWNVGLPILMILLCIILAVFVSPLYSYFSDFVG